MTTEGRRIAEDGITRARTAYERYAEAGEIALNAFETATGRVVAGMRTLSGTSQGDGPAGGAPQNAYEAAAARNWAALRKVAERVFVASDANMRAGFDFAERLVQAKDPQEAMALQSAYLREQAERFAGQMLDLQKTATQAVKDISQTSDKP